MNLSRQPSRFPCYSSACSLFPPSAPMIPARVGWAGRLWGHNGPWWPCSDIPGCAAGERRLQQENVSRSLRPTTQLWGLLLPDLLLFCYYYYYYYDYYYFPSLSPQSDWWHRHNPSVWQRNYTLLMSDCSSFSSPAWHFIGYLQESCNFCIIVYGNIFTAAWHGMRFNE